MLNITSPRRSRSELSEERGKEELRRYEEINEKIRRGDAIVMTAEEFINYVERRGLEKAAKEVDIVTTGTFGAMCSSRGIPKLWSL